MRPSGSPPSATRSLGGGHRTWLPNREHRCGQCGNRDTDYPGSEENEVRDPGGILADHHEDLAIVARVTASRHLTFAGLLRPSLTPQVARMCCMCAPSTTRGSLPNSTCPTHAWGRSRRSNNSLAPPPNSTACCGRCCTPASSSRAASMPRPPSGT
jgi:hypothetical protein